MSILQKIQSYFKSKTIETPSILANTTPEIVQNNELTALPEPQIWLDNQPSQEELPQWLSNQDSLRDEGVLFGLSDAKAEEKTAIIKYYFAQQTAGVEQEIEQQNEHIGELNQWIAQKEDLLEQLDQKIQNLKNQEFTEDHHLFRTIVGLVVSVGMSVGNFFLIDQTLATTYTQSTWVAMGVFLAGMFNLFGRTSFLHENHDMQHQALWKRLLEEFGMPLAASFFVFVHALATKPTLQAYSLWAFCFFLFLFSGKLLLGNLTMFQRDLNVFNRQRTLENDKIYKVKEWENDIATCKTELANFRTSKHEILPILTELSTKLIRKNAQRDALVKLFESEFYLARNLKNQLSSKQIKSILG
jgi:hypothetical protein